MYDGVSRDTSSVVIISAVGRNHRQAEVLRRASSATSAGANGNSRDTNRPGAIKKNAASAIVGNRVISKNRTRLFAGLYRIWVRVPTIPSGLENGSCTRPAKNDQEGKQPRRLLL